jgi:hypothetical protein
VTPLRRTLAGSAAIGFVLGVAYVDLQWAVEHAQVLAGLVRYPLQDPIGVVQAGPWSLVSQIAAMGLRLGLAETQVSWLLSGILGALSCLAIATTVFAITGREFLSLGVLFVIIVSRAVDWGASYQISLHGSAHTYGVAGLSLAVLALALAGAGAWRAGVFAAVLALGVQTPSGLFVVLVFAWAWVLEAASDWKHAVALARQARFPVAAAVLVLMISLAVFAARSDGLPSVAEASPYLEAFFRHWDGHRQPLGWTARPLRIAAGLAVVALVWWSVMGKHIAPSARWFLGAACIAALLGLAGAAATNMPWESQPLALTALMPGRFLNVSLMLAAPVLLGVACTLPGAAGVVNSVVFALLLLLSRRSLVWSTIADIPHGSSTVGFDQLSVLGVMCLAVLIQISLLKTRRHERPPPARSSRVLRAALTALVIGAAMVTIIQAVRQVEVRGHVWRHRENDPVFAAASGAGRILMGGDAWLIQHRTRSPLVFDAGTLDVLPYQPAAGAAIVRILRDLYETDLLRPPPGMRPEGRVPPAAYREAWERRSWQEWERLARDFGFGRVLTDAGWRLNLRRLAESHGLQVFAVERP